MSKTMWIVIGLVITVAAAAGTAIVDDSSLGGAAVAMSRSNDGSLDGAVARYEAGDLAGARADLETILASDPENQAALYYLGRIALDERDIDGAIDHLEKAVELNGNSSAYETALGRAYIEKLQTVSFFEKGMLAGRALDHLRKAVDLDPANVEARIYLAGYYANAPSIAGGSTKKAREQAEEILKYDAVQGNAILADIDVRNEEYDAAIDKYEKCIEERPDNIQYRYRLGMLYQKLERFEEAFGHFERILDIEPNTTAALYQIGRTAVFSGTNMDRGIACLEQYLALDLQPGNPGYDSAHWRLGMLYEKKKDLASARREFETAVRLNPDEGKYAESLTALGDN